MISATHILAVCTSSAIMAMPVNTQQIIPLSVWGSSLSTILTDLQVFMHYRGSR